MRRVFAMVTTAALFIAGGCGKSYEDRLERTLDRMQYQRKLDKNLMPAPGEQEGKFRELTIFVRPPLNFTLNKETPLSVVEPGKFDLEATFLNQKAPTESMHLLARIKRAKTPSKKAPAPADTASRGPFTADVVTVVNTLYGSDLDGSKFKEETKKGGNKFRRSAPFDANGKNVQVYIYGGKNDPHEIALIFEYPKSEHASLSSKIELCLESFAVGRKAQRAYAGTEGEEESGEGGAGGGAGVVF